MATISKVYDPKTARPYNDHWVDQDYSRNIPDLEAGEGYTSNHVYEAYRGSPEAQGYVSVSVSDHPLAIAWVADQKTNEIASLKSRLAEPEGE